MENPTFQDMYLDFVLTNDGKIHVLDQEELEEAYRNIRFIKDMCEDYSLLKPLKIPELKWKDSSYNGLVSAWYDKIPMFKTFMESEE